MSQTSLPSRKRDAVLARLDRFRSTLSRSTSPARSIIDHPKISKPVASSSVDRLHEEAFQKFQDLNPKDAELLKTYIDPEASSQWHEETAEFMNSQMVKAKADRLKVQLRSGKILIVSDLLGKFTGWIQKMVAVGDTVVQFDPVHAALPWAAFRFILQSALNYHEADTAVWDGIESVCKELVWASLQETLYLESASLSEVQLRKAFVAFYVELFTVLARYLDRLSTSRGTRLLLSPFISKSHFQLYLTNIDEAKRAIESFSQQVTRETQLEQNAKIKLVLDNLVNLKAPVNRLQIINERMYSQIEQKEQDRLLEWVSNTRQADHFSRAFAKALPDTGQWLFENEQFRKWRSSSTAEILRLHGKAGSGKSTLFSILLNDLQHETQTRGLAPPVYFYCARTTEEPKRSQPLHVLRCLLKQLSRLPGGSRIHQAVIDRYNQRETSGELQEKDVLSLCRSCIEGRGPTLILVDAIDESDPISRDILLGGLIRLLEQSSQIIKIFVTSRDQRYEGKMLEYPELVITPGNNAGDIELYIASELDRLEGQRLLLDGEISSDLRFYIKESLIEKANGMFRWVAIQLQTLKHFLDEVGIRKHLGNLTVDLTESYQNLFQFEINHLERNLPGTLELALRTFKWLIVAQKQLSSNDFCTLVGHVDAKHVPKPIDHLLKCCFSLVEYDQAVDTFRFCHLSVREFFESEHFKSAYPDFEESKIHASMATACLSFLSTGQEKSLMPPDYAMWYWTYHAWRAGEQRLTGELKEGLHRLLSDIEAFWTWKDLILSTKHKHFHEPWPQYIKPEFIQPLLVIITWNFHELVAEFSDKKDLEIVADIFNDLEDVHCQSPEVYGLLGYVADTGHLEVLQALLELGMDFASTKCSLNQAISKASFKGHVTMVDFLLKHSVRTHAGLNLDQAILAALRDEGGEEIMRLLLDHSTHIIEKESLNEALIISSRSRKQANIVQLLLEHGADVNYRSNSSQRRGCRPLTEASSYGCSRIVDLLIEHGADVDLMDRNDQSALIISARAWDADTEHVEIVRALLRCGANINAQDRSEYSALMHASWKGYDAVLELLLSSGADMDITTEYGSSALTIALSRGHAAVVRKFLDHRKTTGRDFADDEIRSLLNVVAGAGAGCRKMTDVLCSSLGSIDLQFDQDELVRGLEKAVGSGTPEDATFLIMHGAAIEKAKTPLIATAYQKNIEFARMLIKYGADVDASNFLATPLALASRCGDLHTMQMLLQRGADVDKGCATDPHTVQTALLAACAAGQDAAVEMLLNNNAKANQQDERGFTPLISAAMLGKVEIAKLLLARGADVNSIGGHHDRLSVLAAAACGKSSMPYEIWRHGAFTFKPNITEADDGGNVEMVRLLLKHGAEVNTIGDYFLAAIHVSDAEIIELLLDNGLDANTRGHGGSALLAAVRTGKTIVAKLLLKHGANVKALDESSRETCLISALEKGNLELIELLLEYGAEVTGASLQTSLIRGNVESVKLLLEHGARANPAPDLSEPGTPTPLVTAIDTFSGNQEIIKLLLEHGADVNPAGAEGKSPLVAAASRGELEIMKLLLKKGAQVNLAGGWDGASVTPLLAAIFFNQKEAVLLLLRHGADVHLEQALTSSKPTKWNALATAVHGPRKGIAELLLGWGADINAGGGNSPTALISCIQQFHVDFDFRIVSWVDWLCKHGANPMIKFNGYNALEFTLKLLKKVESLVVSGGGASVSIRGDKADKIFMYRRVAEVLRSHGAEVSENHVRGQERRAQEG